MDKFIKLGNLRTSKERVRLLKAGLNGKQIEKLYLKVNGLTIVNNVLKE